jgi:hypothetical protein
MQAARLTAAAIHPTPDLVPAAVNLGARLGGQSPAFTRRLAATLRMAAGHSYQEILAAETAAQQRSLAQPEFLTGIGRARLSRRT